MSRDSNGQMLRTGMHVRWVGNVPTSLLRNLPLPDQRAIQQAKEMTVEGDDDFGNVELRFKDRSGSMHWIWVKPDVVIAESSLGSTD
jgi:hypothetical protein